MGGRRLVDFLIVDDDDSFREQLGKALSRRGFVCAEASSFETALAACEEAAPRRAIIDLRMPGKSGLDLVAALKAREPETEIVVLTAYGSIVSTQDAIKKGATAYLTKPCGVAEILSAFEGPEAGASVAVDFPSIAQVEWDYIQRVLRDCGGNVTRTAQVLGLDRRSLQRRLANPPDLK